VFENKIMLGMIMSPVPSIAIKCGEETETKFNFQPLNVIANNAPRFSKYLSGQFS
jgi:hypothetical protein